MHLHSCVLGGAGPKVEEDDDTPLEPNNPCNANFRMHSFITTENGSHQESPVPTSPASSDSSFSHESGISSVHDPPRRGEPAWIARPRNPFIIFRCEYSREHSRGNGKRVRRPPGSQPIEKTLSKKAAEAWHQLSPQEKNRFKELADKEKEEHARLHPNYRFKPMKRGNQAASRAVAKKHPVLQPLVPKPHSLGPSPPILAPSPRHPLQQAVSDPLLPPNPMVLPDPAVAKGGRRRSASDPLARFGQHLYIPEAWSPHSHELVMKRSQSAMGSRLPLHYPNTGPPSPCGEQLFDPRIIEVSQRSRLSQSLSLVNLCVLT